MKINVIDAIRFSKNKFINHKSFSQPLAKAKVST